jgi:hypothetical protein
MIVINWNPLVNTEFSLEGDYGYDSDYVKSLKFESGKERIYLKNNFVPKVYNLSIVLNDRKIIMAGAINTECKQFKYWYEYGLRYGILPFYAPRVKSHGETGIYEFVPESLQYSGAGGYVTATFTVKEIG